MNVNDLLHGFRVTRATPSDELGGTLWEMTYEKTGTELVWLDNGQSNKVFSIAFKTLPWDDTGVFHILEHSVLAGSRKYPVKEPFLDLLKSSMQTFLNAMTFPDKTVYPVASRNEQDFMNLVDVYLDAVFFPAIYWNPNIFYQEGWHHELMDPAAVPVYKGVVFNEMKGATSSVDSILDDGIRALLYPDSCYGCNSGGHPKHIPELTYENFLNAHRAFYHPTNARIYLDGAVPLERVLQKLDQEYLSQFGDAPPLPVIVPQAPVSPEPAVTYYEIGPEDGESGKSHIAFGRTMGTWQDQKKLLALGLLCDYLTQSNAAPLTKAVLDSGLAQDVQVYLESGIAQPYLLIALRNTEYDHRDALKDLVCATIRAILAQGIDHQELSASLNQLEFSLRQPREPQGIRRAIGALSTWLYGGQALDGLCTQNLIDQLRADLDQGYFETLLSELLLDQPGTAQLSVLPSKTLGQEDRAWEQAQLDQAAASWSDADRAALVALNENLARWQQEPDSPEAAATLPVLSLSDLGEKPEEDVTLVGSENGIPTLYHPIPSNGIVHTTMYFNIADVPVEDLPVLSFLCSLLTQLPAGDLSALQLQQQIREHIGSLSIRLICSPVPGSPDRCKPKAVVSMSLLEHKLPQGLELLGKILTATHLTDAADIQNILMQNKEMVYQDLMSAGDSFARIRAMQNHSATARFQEQAGGYSYYLYLSSLADGFQDKAPSFLAQGKALLSQVFATNRLTLSQTCTTQHPIAQALCALLPQGAAAPEVLVLPITQKRVKEVIEIPFGISYAALGGNLYHCGGTYQGRLQVLANLMRLSYLWSEIRVKGGAYGCRFGADVSGDLTFTSFRDPTPLRSLGVYCQAGAFLRDFCQGQEDLDKFIISSVSASEPLQTVAQQGAAMDSRWFAGVTYEERCQRRADMLHLTKEDLLELCGLFDTLAAQGSQCVIGNHGALTDLDGEWTVHTL